MSHNQPYVNLDVKIIKMAWSYAELSIHLVVDHCCSNTPTHQRHCNRFILLFHLIIFPMFISYAVSI